MHLSMKLGQEPFAACCVGKMSVEPAEDRWDVRHQCDRNQGKPAAGRFTTLSRDVFAGLITSTISVAYGLSFAALIFASPLTPWVAYGIAATFLTTAISAVGQAE
jgi:hypothetical protein